MNRDLFMNADLKQTALATMATIDALQSKPQHTQLAAISAAFLLLVEQTDITLAEVIGAARNMMNTAEGKRPEFLAVADYLKHELLNK